MFRLSDHVKESIPALLNAVTGEKALLLAEPQSFAAYGLHRHLDFSHGEPEIAHCDSRVLIFPADSLMRMLDTDPDNDSAEIAQVMSRMKADRAYHVTTREGTDLQFTARHWIPLDFEVCTVPVEEKTEGRIVVDGAVFFLCINVQLLTIEAAMTRKRDKIYQAAMLDPHCQSELSIDDIVHLCDDLIEAHAGWLPEYN